ncbi:MAG: hypothetical protein AAF927_13095 [Bacteroidota bacterium]
MKSSSSEHKDPQLAEMLQSVAPTKAPAGLADKLMLSVEAVALRRKRVRKNLRVAMAGVGSTLGLMIAWLVGGKTWVAELVSEASVAYAEANSLIMLMVTVLGMIALFIELEFTFKYWGQLRKLSLKA